MHEWRSKLSNEERNLLTDPPSPQGAKPQLATLADRPFSDPGWIFERKFDGERILAFAQPERVSLRTRNGKVADETYPEIVKALKQRRNDVVLDGEVVAFDGPVTSFSRLQQRMQIKSEREARRSGVPVFYYVFDILSLDGFCLEDLPLRRRKALLKQEMKFSDPVRYAAHRNEAGEAFFRQACEKGWEGVIAKNARSRYRRGRSRDWLKFKCVTRQEFVIGGYTEPHGGRIGFGALLLGYYDAEGALRYAGRVGTGFDDEDLRVLHARFQDLRTGENPFANEPPGNGTTWLDPRLVAEIGFSEWTYLGRLRHPRFLGLRRDKSAKEVFKEED